MYEIQQIEYADRSIVFSLLKNGMVITGGHSSLRDVLQMVDVFLLNKTIYDVKGYKFVKQIMTYPKTLYGFGDENEISEFLYKNPDLLI